MIGAVPHEDAVHFLLLGHSREHILEAIDKFEIRSVVIFTSRNLLDESKAFTGMIEGRGTKVLELVALDPFDGKSIERMTREIIDRYDHHTTEQSKTIIAGLTGGTNLMAISMSLAALIRGMKCHYMAKSEDGVPMEIGLFEKLNKAGDIEAMMHLVTESVR